MNFTHLKQQIHALSLQADEIDKRRGENAKPLFDERLFSCRSARLSPCVLEVESAIDALEKNHVKNALSSEKTSHLCEKLINQISALQREIATLTLRAQEQNFSFKPKASLNLLYQALAQHLSWEWRLESKIKETEKALQLYLAPQDQQAIQNQLLHLEKRLNRCKNARQKIEGKITLNEKKRRG